MKKISTRDWIDVGLARFRSCKSSWIANAFLLTCGTFEYEIDYESLFQNSFHYLCGNHTNTENANIKSILHPNCKNHPHLISNLCDFTYLLCNKQYFFVCPHIESQWGPFVFWNPLTFILFSIEERKQVLKMTAFSFSMTVTHAVEWELKHWQSI